MKKTKNLFLLAFSSLVLSSCGGNFFFVGDFSQSSNNESTEPSIIEPSIPSSEPTSSVQEVDEYFEVSFVDYAGEVLYSDYIVEGGYAVYDGEEPGMKEHNNYYYVFTNWYPNPETTPIYQDTIFYAEYNAQPETRPVSFINYDESIMYSYNAYYGQRASFLGNTPIKPDDDEYTYTFTGWYPDLSNTVIYEATEFYAQYQATKKETIYHTVTFLNVDVIFETQSVQHGQYAVEPRNTPQKEGDETVYYVFSGWTPKVNETPITQDTTFMATYIEMEVGNGEKVTIDDFESYNDSNLPNYETKKYSIEWVDTAAYLKYEEGEISPLSGTKSGRFHVWNNGVAFKASRDVTFTQNTLINNFHVDIKTILGSKISFRFTMTDYSYFYYEISQVGSNGWLNIDIPLKDFIVNGNGTTLEEATIEAGISYETDILNYINKFEIVYCYSNNFGTETDVFLDNISFNYVGEPSLSILPILEEGSEYVYSKIEDDVVTHTYSITIKPNNYTSTRFDSDYFSWPYTPFYDESTNTSGIEIYAPYSMINMRLAFEDNRLIFISASNGLFSDNRPQVNEGEAFMLKAVMNDFEQYTETGVGYDKNHAASERSGMRGDIYCDYYSGTTDGQSPIGGNGWSLMGSTDYANLCTESETETTIKNFAQLKSSSMTMRYMSWSAYSETHNKGYKGSALSLMIKGGTTADRTCRIKVYYSKTVTTTTQTSNCAAAEFTITAGSDWTEYTIELNTSKVYYSIAITFVVPSGGNTATQRIGVDDIVFHY